MITILAPLRTEALAARLGLRGSTSARIVRTGAGATRSSRHAGTPSAVVLGVCGALVSGLAPGTLIVSAPSGASSLLAGLVDAGLSARVGTIADSDKLVRGASARAALAATTGAVGVDLESAALSARQPAPLAIVRAVVDTPDAELLAPTTVTGGLRALGALRRATPVVVEWAAALSPSPRLSGSAAGGPTPRR